MTTLMASFSHLLVLVLGQPKRYIRILHLCWRPIFYCCSFTLWDYFWWIIWKIVQCFSFLIITVLRSFWLLTFTCYRNLWTAVFKCWLRTLGQKPLIYSVLNFFILGDSIMREACRTRCKCYHSSSFHLKIYSPADSIFWVDKWCCW